MTPVNWWRRSRPIPAASHQPLPLAQAWSGRCAGRCSFSACSSAAAARAGACAWPARSCPASTRPPRSPATPARSAARTGRTRPAGSAPPSSQPGSGSTRRACADRRSLTPSPPGAYRVLVLGDSFTFALQVAEEETFVARLAERAQRQRQRATGRDDQRRNRWLEHRQRAGLVSAGGLPLRARPGAADVLRGQRSRRQRRPGRYAEQVDHPRFGADERRSTRPTCARRLRRPVADFQRLRAGAPGAHRAGQAPCSGDRPRRPRINATPTPSVSPAAGSSARRCWHACGMPWPSGATSLRWSAFRSPGQVREADRAPSPLTGHQPDAAPSGDRALRDLRRAAGAGSRPALLCPERTLDAQRPRPGGPDARNGAPRTRPGALNQTRGSPGCARLAECRHPVIGTALPPGPETLSGAQRRRQPRLD